MLLTSGSEIVGGKGRRLGRVTLNQVDRKWGFWDIDLGNFRELGQDFLYLF